jgi:hypothetical protein
MMHALIKRRRARRAAAARAQEEAVKAATLGHIETLAGEISERVAVLAAIDLEPPKARRGRPAGSKNKSKPK